MIAEFKLSGKVTHCIAESGSNFVKAFDEFGSIIDKETSICSSDDDVATQSNEVETINGVSISDFMRCELDEKDFDLPAHVKYAAHKISVVATEDSLLALSDDKYNKVYRSIMAKLSAI